MKSKSYLAYKTYIYNNPEYINLMFLSFLFKEIRGLYSCLVDDIIQTKYTSAPSIKTFVEKLANFDDERFAVYKCVKRLIFDESRRNKYMKREKPCFHIERKTLKKGHRTRSKTP